MPQPKAKLHGLHVPLARLLKWRVPLNYAPGVAGCRMGESRLGGSIGVGRSVRNAFQ